MNPRKDPNENDAYIWKTNKKIAPKNLNIEEAIYILVNLAKDFSVLCAQERDASTKASTGGKLIIWKPIAHGFQETCDVCAKTIFNMLWICKECGFTVCIECFNERKDFEFCESGIAHSLSEILPTQVIPYDLVTTLLEEMCNSSPLWKMPHYSKCMDTESSLSSLPPEGLPANFIYQSDNIEYLGQYGILRLMSPFHQNNGKNFRAQVRVGRPIVISNLHKSLQSALWRPSKFSQLCGEEECSLINCRNGRVVPMQKVRIFWDGFTDVDMRLRDEFGKGMTLMLKDWPQHTDFANLLPKHYEDFMQCLPLPDYTKRSGRLNLVNRLPDIFLRPELGPKMYTAYQRCTMVKTFT